ncbi:GPI anchored serine-threonine rich protein [Colletotrichum plurivorum]|uniref:GPI anchored serine-threonine rich protein n=1 Tax=Colletotrichum plurivorum TaxID=2175906 RepID=A0A8H6K239_9PEZI|nr:GPI anchored serine-threonine rich protein [Colletotrichum plurivorum]
MFKRLLLLALTASPALALEAEGTSPLFRRQSTCAIGWKVCGDGCIPQLYTCCPSQKGGCSSVTSVCQLGSNGEYLCCPIGRTCVGAGGVTTIPGGGGTIISTRTVAVPGDDETSTSTSTFTIDVPGFTSTFTVDVPDVSSKTTTTTSEADETTNVPTPVIPDETSTTTTTTSTRRGIASGSPSTTSVPTITPPVTTNGALSYGASFFQAIAAGIIALFVI